MKVCKAILMFLSCHAVLTACQQKETTQEEKSKDLLPSRTSAPISEAKGLINFVFSLNHNACNAIHFETAIPAKDLPRTMFGGFCPKTIQVGTKTANRIHTCDSFKDNEGTTYTNFIYDKILDATGKVVDVTLDAAKASCEGMKNGVLSNQEGETPSPKGQSELPSGKMQSGGGQAPDAAANQTPSEAVGSWVSCQVNPEGGGYGSFSSLLTTEANGQLVLTGSGHPDAACKDPFTDAQLEKMQEDADPTFKIKPAGDKAQIVAAMRRAMVTTQKGIYKAEAKNSAGDTFGTMDMETAYDGVKAYTSFVVKQNILKFIAPCVKEELDEGLCDSLIGETSQNRAKDFKSAALMTLKKK